MFSFAPLSGDKNSAVVSHTILEKVHLKMNHFQKDVALNENLSIHILNEIVSQKLLKGLFST